MKAILFLLLSLPLGAVVEPYAQYHFGDGDPATNGGHNLPWDSSGHGRHFTGSAPGTPELVTTGGPNNDAYYRFNGTDGYFYTSAAPWNPPEDNVGVEIWVRTSNLSQANRNIFGTGTNLNGLNIGYDAGGSRGWFGAVAGVAFAGTTGTSSYVPGEWIHLAVVRASGLTTFYVNGTASGSVSSTPNDASGVDALHLAVSAGGGNAFNGDIAEARVFTFASGAFNPATDLQTSVPVSVQVHEAAFPTEAGKGYIASFNVTPGAGETTVPRLRLEMTGTELLQSTSLSTLLPPLTTQVPYRVRFTADSASTTLRFFTAGGDAAGNATITGTEVFEPKTLAPANTPNDGQQAQIDRRYGLFLHFGINTYHDEEWTDGTKPPSSYQPTNLDVEQWVQTAYEAGMGYVLIIAKHHDGFCMWNSPWTDYDVASSPVTTDVIAAASAACKKYGLRLAIYYSLWDRHEPTYENDTAYNQYMLRQLGELLGNYGSVSELWLDGGWVKANTRWPMTEIYDLARRLQPDCQISANWTIGLPENSDAHPVLPGNQQEGFPIRYFPSDFRLGDPYQPKVPDPKLFTHEGQTYYLPFESTVTLSGVGQWFYHTTDTTDKSVEQLATLYYGATAQNNILVLNAPPDRSGRLRDLERTTLFQLRDKLGLRPGQPLPRKVSEGASATASAVWTNDNANYGAQLAIDNRADTRWASGPAGLTSATFTLDFGVLASFDRMMIDEYEASPGVGRIKTFHLETWNGSVWVNIHQGTTCGRLSLQSFPRQTSSKVRLVIDTATDAPSLWELQVQDSDNAFGSWRASQFPQLNSNPRFGRDGDPDGDGLSNRMEFALGTSPTAANALPLPASADGKMLLNLPWNPQATSTHADIQYSLDLSEWFEASAPLHAGVVEIAGSATMKSWSIDPTICPHWFYRVR